MHLKNASTGGLVLITAKFDLKNWVRKPNITITRGKLYHSLSPLDSIGVLHTFEGWSCAVVLGWSLELKWALNPGL